MGLLLFPHVLGLLAIGAGASLSQLSSSTGTAVVWLGWEAGMPERPAWWVSLWH